MASTIYSYNLTGGRVFPVAFEYLARRFVRITLVGATRLELQLNVDYRFISKTEIETTVAWTSGEYQTIEVQRVTSATDRLVNFTDGSILRSQDLNISQIQAIHIAEEGRDVAENSMISGGLFWDALGLPIKNVGYPSLPTDAANGQYVLDNMRTALRVTPSETITEIPSDRANKVLAFDANRQPITIIPSAGSSMELELALRNEVDPLKGAGMIGAKRTPLADAIVTTNMTLGKVFSTFKISVWEFIKEIPEAIPGSSSRSWDWTPAIQKGLDTINTMSYGGILELPTEVYRITKGLKVDYPRTSIQGNGSTIYGPVLTETMLTITKTGVSPNGPYGTVQASISGLKLIGPGIDTVNAIEVGAMSGPGPTPVLNGIYCQGFKSALNVLQGGYLIRMYNFEAYQCTNAVELLAGITNMGENISMYGGAIHGCRRIVYCTAVDASIHFFGTSMDFNGVGGNSQFYMRGSMLTLHGCHWEMGNTQNPVSVTPIDVSGDQCGIRFNGGTILCHTGFYTAPYFVTKGAGSSVSIKGPRVLGIVPTIAMSEGPGRFITEDWEIGNVSVISAKGSDNLMVDPSFSKTTIQDPFFIDNGRAGTDRFATDNMRLTISDLQSSVEGSKSLRIEKKFGGGTVHSVSILFPAQKGKRHSLRFKMLNNNSRAGTIYATMGWARSFGNDANGQPVYTKVADAFTTIPVIPTNEWKPYLSSNYINGRDEAACPPNADNLVVTLNLNGFTGGEGAPEGGWYSIYVDEFEVYEW